MNEPTETKTGPRSRPRAEHRGELFWRGVRYVAAVFAGYLLGIAAGRLGGDSPGWPLIVLVAAVALFLVFRQGRKSVSHAAADAISAAHAHAAAQAVNRNEITVAGGHVVQASAVDGSTSAAVRVLDAERGLVELPDGRVCVLPLDGPGSGAQVVEMSRNVEAWDSWDTDAEVPI